MNKLSLFLIAILAFVSCSDNDDGNSDANTPNSLDQSEWGHKENDRGYYIYFSLDNSMRISHPFYNVGTGKLQNIEIDGEFTYDKPKVTLKFYGECSNDGFVFSSCNVSGVVNGHILTINDNGTDYIFENLYPDE